MMRKLLLVFAVLLNAIVPSNAAYWQGQTYLPPADPRVQKNLVSDYGASCNTVAIVTNVTTNSGSPNLQVSTPNTFSSGDVGKSIIVRGAASGGGNLTTTILTFTDDTHVVLAANAGNSMVASSRDVVFGADDTAAFLAFKAANQGSTPVQLNLPGYCTFLPAGGTTLPFPFKGVLDLIVAGTGQYTSGIVSLGGGILMGATGEFYDNQHSIRTQSASAGDSCVTLKAAPSFNVTDIQNNLPLTAKFTATLPASSTTMTVSAVASGTIPIGAFVNNSFSSFTSFTKVIAQLTGTGGAACPDPTCNGTTGTYQVSASPAITQTNRPTFTLPASFNASVDALGVMTVNSIADGAIYIGMWPYSNGGGISKAMFVKSQLTGTPGGVGTYQLSELPASVVTSRDFIGNGQPRVTVNSTAGLTSGDTVPMPDITNATGQLRARTNGLQWIKVIDGTHFDLFQQDFDGGFVSGTWAGGGDKTSLFPVGNPVMMGGYTLQSYWAQDYGDPSNLQWFEFKRVVSTNSTTHQVCLDTPLTYAYKSTWPQFNTGGNFRSDPGGPATLFALDPTWDMTVVFKDLTLNASSQTYTQARNVTFRNVFMTGGGCAIPTQNETYSWINVDAAASCNMETDKLVKTWNITNSTIRRVHVQSSSIETININGLTADTWGGTSKFFYADGLTTTCASCGGPNVDNAFTVGTSAYGATEEVTCTNCYIPPPPGNTTGINAFGIAGIAGSGQRVDLARTPWSMSGGVITIPNQYNNLGDELQIRSVVPGLYMHWNGSGGGGTAAQVGRMLKIVDVTQDLDNVYVHTSEAGGFPTGAWTTNGLSLVPHPAPKFTASFLPGTGLSGTVYNGCTAQAPLYSCANFVSTGGASGSSNGGYTGAMWGVLDTFTFTNNVPYTNTGSLQWTIMRFGNAQVLKTDLTTTNWGVAQGSGGMLNTKLPSGAGGGTRTLTQSGATGTQTGDNITPPPTDAWFGGSFQPVFGSDTPSDSPQVTVTLRTNQQFPP